MIYRRIQLPPRVHTGRRYFRLRPRGIDAEGAVPVLRKSRGLVVAEAEVVEHELRFDVEGGNADVLTSVGLDNRIPAVRDHSAVVPRLVGSENEGNFGARERVEAPPEVEVSRPIAVVRLVPEPNGAAVRHPGALGGVPLEERPGVGNPLELDLPLDRVERSQQGLLGEPDKPVSGYILPALHTRRRGAHLGNRYLRWIEVGRSL